MGLPALQIVEAASKGDWVTGVKGSAVQYFVRFPGTLSVKRAMWYPRLTTLLITKGEQKEKKKRQQTGLPPTDTKLKLISSVSAEGVKAVWEELTLLA